MIKTFAIVFQNIDTGKVDMDCFSGISEKEARRDFNECYRHARYSILSVTLVPDLKSKED